MDTKTRLQQALNDAMRSGNDTARRTIRMTLAAIKQIEIDTRQTVDESGVITVLQKEKKIRNEALQDAVKANRADLVFENESEIAIIDQFLPKQLSPDELRNEVVLAVTELQAASLADMGKVIKVVRTRLEGKATGEAISRVVKSVLSGE